MPSYVTPNTSDATFLIQVAIFTHMLFASSSSYQAPSTKTLLKNFGCPSFEFPPLRPRKFGLFISMGMNPKTDVSHHKIMLGHVTLSRYHLAIQTCLFIFSPCENEVDQGRTMATAKSHQMRISHSEESVGYH
jgi:hypothetical protein